MRLKKILSKILKSTYGGVIAKDELSKTTLRPLAIIVNSDHSSDSGTHWTCLYLFRDEWGEFFDSLWQYPNHFDVYIPWLTTLQKNSSIRNDCVRTIRVYILYVSISEDLHSHFHQQPGFSRLLSPHNLAARTTLGIWGCAFSHNVNVVTCSATNEFATNQHHNSFRLLATFAQPEFHVQQQNALGCSQPQLVQLSSLDQVASNLRATSIT